MVSALGLSSFGASKPLSSGKGKGGAKLDPMIYGFIVRLASYMDVIGARVISIIGLIENEPFVALTGQDGVYGFYLSDGKNPIGPIGCPTLGKIMAHFGIDILSGIVALSPDDENPDAPDILSVWNRERHDGPDADADYRCHARIELAKQITKYTAQFKVKGNPFLKIEESLSTQGKLFDSDKASDADAESA